MADIFPYERVSVPAEIEQLIGFCAKFPTDWQVYVGWPDLAHNTPDVLVVTAKGQLGVLSASGAGLSIIDQWSPSQNPAPDSSLPLRRLARAIKALNEQFPSPVLRKLVFTRAKARDIPLTLSGSLPVGITWHAIDYPSALKELQSEIESCKPCPQEIDALRARINPPSVVAVQMTASRLSHSTKCRFLDRDQEQWLRRFLAPPPDIERIQELSAGPHLITGVAGCGKSLLLLYRGVMERKNNPNLHILLLTHNRALTNDLKSRAKILATQINTTTFEIKSFHSWCYTWFSKTDRWPEVLGYEKLAHFINDIFVDLNPTRLRFLTEEFAWIGDEGINSEESYRAVNRQGRLRPLNPSERTRVWEEYTRYRTELAKQGGSSNEVTDWPGLTRQCLNHAEKGHVPRYDLILVDEAQFFSPVAIRILLRAMADGGRIVFAADPTQGFLQRRNPWASAGIDFRGRATRLRRPYRSTREILVFARNFYVSRVNEEALADTNLPTNDDLASAASGVLPEICPVDRNQDETQVCCCLIRHLLKQGTQANDLLVLHDSQISIDLSGPGWKSYNAKKGGSDLVLKDYEIRTCSFDAATGLEAPYVIVMGLQRLLERENDPLLGPDQEQMILDSTRKAYMAFTRAGHRLMILWSGSKCPEILLNGARQLERTSITGELK